jgi:hypothetical protein
MVPTPPFPVRVALMGIRRKQTAWTYCLLCIAAAVVFAAFGIWEGMVMLLAAAWYWIAIRWHERHGGWVKDPQGVVVKVSA